MSEHSTPLTKADLIYRFDKQIEEVKAKGETSNGHGEAFEGKWVGDELVIWDNHFAWENNLHAKLSFIEASNGSIVKITYRHREGRLIRIGLMLMAPILMVLTLNTIELVGGLVCYACGLIYDWYKLDQRRKPVKKYVLNTIQA